MFSKVILIQVDSIIGYPPTLSLITELVNSGIQVSVLTTVVNDQLRAILPKSVDINQVGSEYKYQTKTLIKLKELFSVRKKIWEYIDAHYDDDTILWVMSNITIKHMGMKLLKYHYNLHLFELVDKVSYFKSCTLGLDLKQLTQGAHKVIVCEYNRAHITQTWFKLNELPLVISNKPMPNNFTRNSDISHSEKAQNIIASLKDKKIILYQGIVDAERPIEPIAKAVDELNDEFVFLVMTSSKCDFLLKYKRTIVMPYIPAPYHMEVTSHAYVGVLIYTPVYGAFSSPLNSIYCAPNKIYEFSQFGIPMIGNDIPGLRYTIDYNRMGICVPQFNIASLSAAIQKIADNYTQYSSNALNFYSSDNKSDVVKQALKKIK